MQTFEGNNSCLTDVGIVLTFLAYGSEITVAGQHLYLIGQS